jgi:hypothetical protein
MDIKERLYSAATQQFDACIEKYSGKIKNCLWGMIYHAYNEGVKDGKKKVAEEMKQAEPKQDVIEIGDEVYDPITELVFIVTEIDDGQVSGIDHNGGVHLYAAESVKNGFLVKTGRRYCFALLADETASEEGNG